MTSGIDLYANEMSSVGTPGTRRLFTSLVGYAFGLLIVVSTLNNQPWANEVYPLGSILNWTAICLCYFFLVCHVGFRWWLVVIPLLLVVAFFFRTTYPGKTFYLTSQNMVFFLTGSLVANVALRELMVVAEKLLIACVLMMLFQVSGVGEWTQYFVTHGTLADGSTVSLTQVPTLFRSLAETGGTFLQGRPAGIFHANQYAVLFVVFMMALEVGLLVGNDDFRSRSRWRWLIFFACALTQSKAAILAFEIMWIILLTRRMLSKLSAVALQAQFLMCFLIYWLLFPGVFEIYMGPEIILNSFAVRMLDFANLLGIDFEDMRRSLDQFKAMSEAVGRIGEVSQRTSGFSQLLQEWALTIPVSVSICFVSWLGRLGVQDSTKGNVGTLVCGGMVGVLMSAALLASQLFWFMFGLGVPWAIWGLDSASTRMRSDPAVGSVV